MNRKSIRKNPISHKTDKESAKTREHIDDGHGDHGTDHAEAEVTVDNEPTGNPHHDLGLRN